MEDRGSPSAESQRLRQICLLNSRKAEAPPPAALYEFTSENFLDEVLNAESLVVLDFWSETRSLCKLMSPVMQRLAEHYVGLPVKVCRVDVLANAEFVKTLGIKAIPHVMVVFRGDIVLELLGDKSFEELEQKLAPFVKSAMSRTC